MTHAHDRTLLASLGFADPDKKDQMHDLACEYLSQPTQFWSPKYDEPLRAARDRGVEPTSLAVFAHPRPIGDSALVDDRYALSLTALHLVAGHRVAEVVEVSQRRYRADTVLSSPDVVDRAWLGEPELKRAHLGFIHRFVFWEIHLRDVLRALLVVFVVHVARNDS